MFPVSYVSAPIDVPDGRGAVVAFTDIEDRLAADEALRQRDEILGREQAALRRVAALVAGGAESDAMFAAMAREVAQVLGLPLVVMSRYDPGQIATVIGAWNSKQCASRARLRLRAGVGHHADYSSRCVIGVSSNRSSSAATVITN